MATIREAKSGYWQAIIRRKGFPDQSKTFEVKKDAENWATIKESEMARGVFVDRSEAESTTLKKALERYEAEVSVNKDGYEQEKYRIGTWKEHPLAKRSLASLRGSDFAKWRDERIKVASPSTLQKDVAIISHLFTIAKKEWGMEVINPISNIKIPTEDNSRERRLEVDEEKALVAQLTPTPGRGQTRSLVMIPLVQLAIETAARKSELLALAWVDVDLKGLSIRIRGKDRKIGKGHLKNKGKYRDVPMSPIAKQVLEDIKGDKVVKIGKVFDISDAVSGNAFTSAVARARAEHEAKCKKNGSAPHSTFMLDLKFHDLRHEATSRLAEIFEIHELMKITDHRSTRMLSRYYHPRVQDLAKKMWAHTQER